MPPATGSRWSPASDALRFHSPVPLQGDDLTTTAEFTVAEGQRRGFSLAWYSALEDPPSPLDAHAALDSTKQYWSEWMERCTYQGEWRDDVVRSLITVKALQYSPTGAVCAAATTSLARAARRRAQLGLPLLVAARLVAHPAGARAERVTRGGGGVAALARNARSRAIRATSRSCTASAANGGSPRSSSTGSRATRTRSPCASATRRASSSSSTSSARSPTPPSPAVEAGLGADRHLPAHHPQTGRAAAGDDGAPRAGVAAARRRHLGDPRSAAALHAVEGDGVGRVRPRREDRRAARVGPSCRSTGGASSPTR